MQQFQDNNFDVTDKGDITDFLGVHIEKGSDNNYVMTQAHLIESILQDMNFTSATKPRKTPMKTTKPLKADKEAEDHKATWHYRSIIGKLNFLEKVTRPDIAYAVHNCARFMEQPKVSHTEAVHDICRYLIGTKDLKMKLKPGKLLFDCYADADFSGLWNKEEASMNRTTALSRTGYIIKYAGCPLVWASKLQTEVALSSTAAEYVALSTAAREVIPLARLLLEIKDQGFLKLTPTP